ncbi:MAG: L,D-transpeptidase family protein [Verrucomicrobiales bacterium]
MAQPSKQPTRHPKLMNRRWLLLCITPFLLTSCVTKDTDHRLVISVPDQQMAVFYRGALVQRYPISTSKYGLGDDFDSYKTPVGAFEIAKKIGDGYPSGAVFKSRKFTGEILAVDAPGRDPIVTRILWLRGLEPQNRNAFNRYIYIHGTPEERNIGKPVSFGCIRMRSRDIIALHERVGYGARVEVLTRPLAEILTPAGPTPNAARSLTSIY